jgi:hypothetical protein
MELRHPPIKTLYMSGYIGYSGTGLAEINSELALLPKPFTRDALLQKVREKLENLGGGKPRQP